MRPTRFVPLVAALTVAVLAGGCSVATRPLAQEAPAGTRQPADGLSAEPSASSDGATDEALPETLTIAVAGDVHFESHLRRLLDDPATALSSLEPTLGAADFTMLNLETAITEGGTRMAKPFTFRAPASALTALDAAGVDAVSLANNHGVDFGSPGLKDTLAAKNSSQIPMVGIGRDATEAFEPLVVTIHGVRVAILAALHLHEETSLFWSATDTRGGVATSLDMTRLREATRSAAAEADVVMVFMHWGTDYTTCADATQKRVAAQLEDDGADLIVGAHAHRIQGAGWTDGAYVAYGLGNFIWWKSQEPDSQTGVLTLTIDAKAARDRRADGAASTSVGSTPPAATSVATTPPATTMSPAAAETPLVTEASWTPMLIGPNGIPREPSDSSVTDRLHEVWDAAGACGQLRPTPATAS